MINNIICPKYFSKDLYRYGKDKHGFQKYQCKSHGCLPLPEIWLKKEI